MFKFVSLPEYFVPFLKCNMQPGSDNFKSLYEDIYSDQGFYSLFAMCFAEFDEKLDPKRIVSALGWENFRNRFSGLFLTYLKEKKFPTTSTEVAATDLILFEKKFRSVGVEGHGRIFMYGLYLKFFDHYH